MDKPTEPTGHLIDDLANWNEGIGVAMINLLESDMLVPTARKQWETGQRILEDHADATPENLIGQRQAYASMLAALIDQPFAVQAALEKLGAWLVTVDPSLACAGLTAERPPHRSIELEYTDWFIAALILGVEVEALPPWAARQWDAGLNLIEHDPAVTRFGHLLMLDALIASPGAAQRAMEAMRALLVKADPTLVAEGNDR